MRGPRLSVCMIVRDEAQLIAAALGSVAGRVDEIVVIDTGSVDATPEIARRYGARVVERAWQESFGAARNAALEQAQGEWCLMLDADERVDTLSWLPLQEFMLGGAELGRVLVISPSRDGVFRERITRLCRRGTAHYRGRIHEQLVGDGRRADTGVVLHHVGYSETMIATKDKHQRNIGLLRLELNEHPDDPYIHYQLGRTLWQRDRSGEAVEHLACALRHVPQGAGFLPALVRDLGYALKDSGRTEEALALVESFQARLPGYTDLVFLRALILLDLNRAVEMVKAFEQCLIWGETDRYASIDGVGSYRAHHNLGLFHELIGKRELARLYYQQALSAQPSFSPSLARLRVLGSQPELAARESLLVAE